MATSSQPKLCIRCQDIFRGVRAVYKQPWGHPNYMFRGEPAWIGPPDWPEPETSYVHHYIAASLPHEVLRGCHLCNLLWRLLSREERSQVVEERSDYTRYRLKQLPSGRYEFQYLFNEAPEASDKWGLIKKSLTLSPASEVQSLIPDRKIKLTSDLESSVVLASWWLSKCAKDHVKCNEASKNTGRFLPTRLIDVGPPDASIKPRLCITVPGHSNPLPAYTTLSHCWGAKPIVRLEVSNLKDMQQQLPVDKLPKTFLDAINITRKMNVRFLWIDALCIIQDSQDGEDWLRESANMHKVYLNSYCNIAATAASDGQVGCFFDRDPLRVNALKIDATWSGLSKGSYYVIDSEMWIREVDQAPLNQRGWVFQERFLTPRNLCFGSERLFWECQELRACESYPGGLPSSINSIEFKVSDPNALAALYRKNDATDGSMNNDAMRAWLVLMTGAQLNLVRGDKFDEENPKAVPNAYRQWMTLVTHYSKELLTNESDRLIALYGVAQWMNERLFEDEYLAGHWKKHLINQLLWATSPHGKNTRANPYRAPSWSWASINGPVHFRDILETAEQTVLAQVIAVEVKTLPQKAGQVLSGFTTIRGTPVPASWRRWRTDSDQFEEKFAFIRDGGIDDSNITGIADVADEIEESGFFKGGSICVAIQSRDPPVNDDVSKEFSTSVEGLVLESVANSAAFRRCGWFLAYGDGAREYKQIAAGLKESEITVI